MLEPFACDAGGTPIGHSAGALSGVRADDLASLPIRALACHNAGTSWGEVDDLILGAKKAGRDNRNVARTAALLADLPESVPCITVNRLCASGLDDGAAALSVASEACARRCDLVLCARITAGAAANVASRTMRPGPVPATLGHPFGKSGIGLVLTATQQHVGDRSARALVTLWAGVGQGPSILLRRV